MFGLLSIVGWSFVFATGALSDAAEDAEAVAGAGAEADVDVDVVDTGADADVEVEGAVTSASTSSTLLPCVRTNFSSSPPFVISSLYLVCS